MSYEGEGRFIGKVRVKKKTHRKKKNKKKEGRKAKQVDDSQRHILCLKKDKEACYMRGKGRKQIKGLLVVIGELYQRKQEGTEIMTKRKQKKRKRKGKRQWVLFGI